MAEDIRPSPEAMEILRLAIAAAQPAGTEFRWRQNVRRTVAMVARIYNPTGREAIYAEKLLRSKFIRGVVTSVEMEPAKPGREPSERALVHFTPESGDVKEDEFLRTERVDTPLGKEQYELLRRCVGHRVLFVVYVEAVSASMKVRTLQDVQDYGPAKEG